jgi:hypothetical protein
LKTFLLNNSCKIGTIIAQNKLNEIENLLTVKFSDVCAATIKEQVGQIETLDGKFSQIVFWKIKRKLCPQLPDPPMAKKNEAGILITNPNLLKKLYLETFKHRLRQREMKTEYMDVFFLKTEL